MKSNKKKKGIGGTIKYLIMILVISAVLAGSGILLCNDLFALAKPDKDITVTIPEDASVSEVSKLLDKSGVINYGSFFHLFTSTIYKDIQFRPGMWTLNSDMDYREIVNQIRLTSKSTVTVTIPEGYTVNEIIDTLVKNGLSSKQELQSAMQNDTFNYDFLPDDLGNQTNRLEDICSRIPMNSISAILRIPLSIRCWATLKISSIALLMARVWHRFARKRT